MIELYQLTLLSGKIFLNPITPTSSCQFSAMQRTQSKAPQTPTYSERQPRSPISPASTNIIGYRPRSQPLSTPADTHYPTSPPRRLKNPNQYLDIEYKAAGVQIRRPAADTLDESAELARQVSREARAQPQPQSSKYDPYPWVTVSEISTPGGILKGHDLQLDDNNRGRKSPPVVGWSEKLSEDIGPSWWRKTRSRRHSGHRKEPSGDPLTKGSSTGRGEGPKRKKYFNNTCRAKNLQ